MKTAFALAVFTLLALPAAKARDLVVSDWVAFPEAQVRLITERNSSAAAPIRAGLEIRLAAGYKTYWRSPGDSGVPPVFDFGRSSGIKETVIRFPFPSRFDDGAGGTALGYKSDIVLPIVGIATGGPVTLALKLDFAVCGTLCIPLSAEITLDPAAAARADADAKRALAAAEARIPLPAEGEAIVERAGPAHQPMWRVRLPYPGDAEGMAVFAEANGFIDVVETTRSSAGMAELTLKGEPAPGSGGRFGPVRLTYGDKTIAFERMIDLDGARATP